MLYTRDPLITMRVDEVKWITAHNCDKQKSHLLSLLWVYFKLKREKIVSQRIFPRKQTTEPHLLILVLFFSGEVTSYTNTSYCIQMLLEVCHSIFYGQPRIYFPLMIIFLPFNLRNLSELICGSWKRPAAVFMWC